MDRGWLGALSLATLAVVVAATTVVSTLHLGRTRYTAEFLQAAGIRGGEEVTVAGVPVGTVEGARLAGDRVVVTMTIDSGVRLGAQTTAAIALTTVLGSRAVTLRPAGPAGLPDRRIPLAQTTVPYDLQRVLHDSTTTFEQVDADRFATSMQTLARQLRDTPSVLPQALANVENLARVLAERRGQISALLRNTAQVATLFGQQQTELGVLIEQGRDLVRELVSRRDAVVRLLNAATTLITTTHDILDAHRPDIDQLLSNIRQLTAMVGDHDALLRNLLQAMPLATRNVANATGTGPFLDFLLPGGLLIDSWLCAITEAAKQNNWSEHFQYFEDCR
ncbi:MCE family protein [Nocardia sp. CDC159]|nr:MCE family protein [Nocardia sp. CDC159]